MNLPGDGDYIDIHNHDGKTDSGNFSIDNLMAHENENPDMREGMTYTYGIHPWYLTEITFKDQIEKVKLFAGHQNVIALGEAGFDKLRGPVIDLQKRAFEAQALIAEEHSKPLFIHCVRAWDELMAEHKRLKPSKPWLIHGFRGKKDLAVQLLSRGMYISFWFEFILRPESSELVRGLPADRIFLETDGSGADIKSIYYKVSLDLNLEIDQLKKQIFLNFKEFFNV